tara:strand:+ start:351 stop:560 length:210 start_codon:yes stop_codon:yes gene_type:complete
LYKNIEIYRIWEFFMLCPTLSQTFASIASYGFDAQLYLKPKYKMLFQRDFWTLGGVFGEVWGRERPVVS